MSYDVTLRVGVDSRKAESTLATLQGSLDKADKSARRAADGMKLFEKAAGQVASVQGSFNAIDKGARRAGEGMKSFEAAVARVGSARGAVNGINDELRRAGDGLKRFSDAARDVGRVKGSLKGVDQGVRKISEGFGSLKAHVAHVVMDKVVEGLKASVRVGAEFHAQMSNVAVASGASDEQLKLLTESAREYGAKGAFSAQQVAKAQQEMAASGMKAHEIFVAQGAVLNLASATQSDFAQVAGLTKKSLDEFGLGAHDAGRVTNTFAAAVHGSKATIETLSKSMDQVGGTAAALGLSVEETSAAIALFHKAGEDGTPAAGALESALKGLTEPSEKGKEVINRLGLEMEDASGKFVGIESMMRQLREANLSYVDSVALFGSESAPAIDAFVDQGADAFSRFKQSITGTTAAADQTRDRLDNLTGDWKEFGSAMDEVGLTVYDAIREPLRWTVQIATEFVNDFTDLINSGLPFDFMKAEAQLWVDHTGDSFSAVLEVVSGWFDAIGINSGSISGALGAVGDLFSDLWETLSSGVLDFPAQFKLLVTTVIAGADKLGIHIETTWEKIKLGAELLWENVSHAAQTAWLKMREGVAEGLQGMMSLVATQIDDVARMVDKLTFGAFKEETDAMRAGADVLRGFGKSEVEEVRAELEELNKTHADRIALLVEEDSALERSAKRRIEAADDAVKAAGKDLVAARALRKERVAGMQEEREFEKEWRAVNAEMDAFNEPVTRQIEGRTDSLVSATEAGDQYRQGVQEVADTEEEGIARTVVATQAINGKADALKNLTEAERVAADAAGRTGDASERAAKDAAGTVSPLAGAFDTAFGGVDEAFKDFLQGGFEDFDGFKEKLKGSAKALSGDLIQLALPDAFDRFFEGGIESFEDFKEKMKKGFKSFLGDLIYQGAANPILLNIQSLLTGGQGGSLGLLGAVAGQSGGYTGGAPGVGDLSSLGVEFATSAIDIITGGAATTALGYAGTYAGAISAGAGTTQAAMLAAQTAEFGAFGASATTSALGGGAASTGIAALAANPMTWAIAGVALLAALNESEPDNYGAVFLGAENSRHATPHQLTSGLHYNTGSAEGDDDKMRQALSAVESIDTALYTAYGSDMSSVTAADLQHAVMGSWQERWQEGTDIVATPDFFIRRWIELADNIAEPIKQMVRDFEGTEEELMAYAVTIPAAFETVSQSFEALGYAFDPLAEGAYSTAMAMVEAAGGLESYQAAANGFFQRFYSPQEQRSFATQELYDHYSDPVNELLTSAGRNAIDFEALVPTLTTGGVREAVRYLQEDSGIAQETLAELIPLLWQFANAAHDSGLLLDQTEAAIEAFNAPLQEIIDSANLSDLDLSLDKLETWKEGLAEQAGQLGISVDKVTEAYEKQREAIEGDYIGTLVDSLGGAPEKSAEEVVDLLQLDQMPSREKLEGWRDWAASAPGAFDLITERLARIGVSSDDLAGYLDILWRSMEEGEQAIARVDDAVMNRVPRFDALKQRFSGIIDSIDEALDEAGSDGRITGIDLELKAAANADVDVMDWDALSARLDAIEEYRDHLFDVIAQERALAKERRDAAASLRDFVKDLAVGELSPDSSAERLLSAQSRYEELRNAASSDPVDLNELTAAARTYLDLARKQYASGERYAQIYQDVTTDLVGDGGGAVGLAGNYDARADYDWIEGDAKTELELLGSDTASLEVDLDGAVLDRLGQIYGSLDSLPDDLATALAPYFGTLPDTSPAGISAEWDRRIGVAGSREDAAAGMFDWATEHGLTTSDFAAARGLTAEGVNAWLLGVPETVAAGISSQWDLFLNESGGDRVAAAGLMRPWADEHGLSGEEILGAVAINDWDVPRLNTWLDKNEINRFATGGIAAPWTPAVVGDGPDWEAVIPLKGGRVPVSLSIEGVVDAVDRSGRASVGALVEIGKKVDEMAGELSDLRRTMSQLEMAA